MVNLRHFEMVRLPLFSASPRLFEFLDCETEIETSKQLCEKIETARQGTTKKRDCETCETHIL